MGAGAKRLAWHRASECRAQDAGKAKEPGVGGRQAKSQRRTLAHARTYSTYSGPVFFYSISR